MVTYKFILIQDLVYESLYYNFDIVQALNVLEYVEEYLFGEGQFADQDGAFGVKLYYVMCIWKLTLRLP